MTVVVISPHPDDAVLSLGQMLAVTPAVVVTVFAGIPSEGLSDYDRSCGFTSSAEAMQARRQEDADACALLGVELVQLDFLDRQYQQPTADDDITAALQQVFKPRSWMVAPLGIGHPDHEQVARCARAAYPGLFLYEELPYRVEHPEQVVDALDKVRAEGFEIADLPHPIGQGPRERKVAALECYRSQFADPAEPMFLCPERCWRIAR